MRKSVVTHPTAPCGAKRSRERERRDVTMYSCILMSALSQREVNEIAKLQRIRTRVPFIESPAFFSGLSLTCA